MQLMFSVQAPHWQLMCVPTRFTSSLSICDSVCASAATARSKNRRLRFNGYILLADANHFRARIRPRYLTRNQTHERAANQDHAAHPDPGDQRKHISLQRGLVAVTRRIVDVKVLVETGAQRHF